MITYVIMIVCFFCECLCGFLLGLGCCLSGFGVGGLFGLGFGGLYGVVVWVVVAGCAAGVCFCFVGFGGRIVGRLWSLVTVVLLLDTLLVLWCWVLVCCFLFVGWFWVLVVGWFAWMVLFGFDVILLSVVLILALWFWLGVGYC